MLRPAFHNAERFFSSSLNKAFIIIIIIIVIIIITIINFVILLCDLFLHVNM